MARRLYRDWKALAGTEAIEEPQCGSPDTVSPSEDQAPSPGGTWRGHRSKPTEVVSAWLRVPGLPVIPPNFPLPRFQLLEASLKAQSYPAVGFSIKALAINAHAGGDHESPDGFVDNFL